jgi:hypothetical protein
MRTVSVMLVLLATSPAAATEWATSLTRLNDPALALFPTQREAHVPATVATAADARHVVRLRFKCGEGLRTHAVEPGRPGASPRYRADAALGERLVASGRVHHSPAHLDVTGKDGTLRLRCTPTALRVDSSGYAQPDLSMLADAHWTDGSFANTFARGYAATGTFGTRGATAATHIRIEAPVASEVDARTGELRATDFVHLYLTRGDDSLYRLSSGMRWHWLNPPSATRRNHVLGNGRLYALIQDAPGFEEYRYSAIAGWSGNEASREAARDLRFGGGGAIILYSAADPSRRDGWVRTTYDIAAQTLTVEAVDRPDLPIVPAEPLQVRQPDLPRIGGTPGTDEAVDGHPR